eukprot:jgi/Botrbrau1/10796/Bobra.0064s0002.1
MGAHVWRRDGQKPNAPRQPWTAPALHNVKRKLVWTRDQAGSNQGVRAEGTAAELAANKRPRQDQSVSTSCKDDPIRKENKQGPLAASNSNDQGDGRRTNGITRVTEENGVDRGNTPTSNGISGHPRDSEGENGRTLPQHVRQNGRASMKMQRAWTADEVEKQREQMEVLRREIEARTKIMDAVQTQATIEDRTRENQYSQAQADLETRRRRFKIIMEQVDEANGAEEEGGVAPSKPVAVADEVEVARVLAASTDYAVLQVQPGTAAADIKRRFREMAISLHPDKCKVEGASDAFQRMAAAYQNVLKFAR